jgi:uncharacterized protein
MAGLGKTYVIAFAGLKPGQHEFEFEADNKFFAFFNDPEISRGSIQVNVSLFRQATMMVLNFRLNGIFDITCDRCATGAQMALAGEHQLVVKLSEPDGSEDDEVIALPLTESEIDLAPFILEYIKLSLPARKVPCEVSGDLSLCDQEVIEKLNLLKSTASEGSDDRMSRLKNIKWS